MLRAETSTLQVARAVADVNHALREHEIERFAVADGFAGTDGCSARRAMGNFWMRHHGPGEFLGLLIRWEPN